MIASPNECTGCMACLNACPVDCILSVEDEEGFLLPSIDHSKCINCGKCTISCPVLNDVIKVADDNPKVYAAWNRNTSILKKSTSGGVFGALAETIIDRNGVVYGATYTDNLYVKHICIRSTEELELLHGSKYVQSDISNIYRNVKKIIDRKQIVLFSGTPCQIAGLYGFLGKTKYENLVTCDFICHGVPSPGVFRRHIEYLEQKESAKLNSIKMRTKRRGWNSVLDMEYVYQNGERKVVNDAFNDPYMNGFLNDLYLRKSCYKCQFAKIPRESDITLGDFWGIGSSEPFIHSTKQGISMVMVNTNIGQKLFLDCSEKLYIEERSITEAKNGNVMLAPHIYSNPLREEFFKDLSSSEFSEIISIYLKNKQSIKTRIIKNIIRMVGYNKLKRIKSVIIRK